MSTSTSANLYQGWMTGFAYRASRDLYFKGVSPTDLKSIDDDRRRKLLEWLETYLNVATDWKAADSEELLKGLDNMIKKMGNKSHTDVTLDNFDLWYTKLRAAIKAKMPFASYAADFADALSQLGHGPTVITSDELFGKLSQALDKLKRAISQDSYRIVKDCIEDLEETPEKFEKREDGSSKIATYANNIDPAWSSLILGTKSASDFLHLTDRFWTGSLFAASGALLFGLLILPLAGAAQISANVVPYLAQSVQPTTLTDVRTLASDLNILVPVLTALGLSASILAKKTWDLLKYLESREILFFAKREILKHARTSEP